MKIRLILADKVEQELSLLNRAESDRDTPSKQLAIAAAKKRIRDNPLDQMELLGKSELHEHDLTLCKKYFRDVGEDCFVFTEQQMQDYIEALKAKSKRN